MKKVLVQTPVGKVEWFNLAKVDKFNAYTCNLILEDTPEMHKLKAQIDELAAGGRVPYKVAQDGKLNLKLKLKSEGQKKTGERYVVNPPVIYSKAGVKLTTAEVLEANIGNGSEIMAKVELSHYSVNGSTGVSCKPKAVLLKKIEQFSAGGDIGFDASEFEAFDEGEQVDSVASTSSDF